MDNKLFVLFIIIGGIILQNALFPPEIVVEDDNLKYDEIIDDEKTISWDARNPPITDFEPPLVFANEIGKFIDKDNNSAKYYTQDGITYVSISDIMVPFVVVDPENLPPTIYITYELFDNCIIIDIGISDNIFVMSYYEPFNEYVYDDDGNIIDIKTEWNPKFIQVWTKDDYEV